MTVQEMHVDFRIKMDKMATNSNISFNEAQIDWLLNEAQLVIIKNTARTRLDYEQSTIDRISSVIVSEVVTPAEDLLQDNVYFIRMDSLEHPYMHYVKGSAKITNTSCTKTLPLKFIAHDDLYPTLQDPFNKSGVDHVLMNFSSDLLGGIRMNLYTDGSFTIDEVNITYIRRPKKISLGTYVYLDGTTIPYQESELPPHVHPEIVDYAVLSAAANVEDPQLLQLKTMKLSNNR